MVADGGTKCRALAAALALVCVSGLVGRVPVAALDNGLGLTPPMGFNPWNCFGQGVHGPKLPGEHGFNASVIMQIADAFVERGLKDAGYTYVNLDCGYSTGFRNASGYLQVNMTAYPDGMKALADYVHGKGLKFGIYSDAGTQQCCSRVHKNANDGSRGHECVAAVCRAENVHA